MRCAVVVLCGESLLSEGAPLPSRYWENETEYEIWQIGIGVESYPTLDRRIAIISVR